MLRVFLDFSVDRRHLIRFKAGLDTSRIHVNARLRCVWKRFPRSNNPLLHPRYDYSGEPGQVLSGTFRLILYFIGIRQDQDFLTPSAILSQSQAASRQWILIIRFYLSRSICGSRPKNLDAQIAGDLKSNPLAIWNCSDFKSLRFQLRFPHSFPTDLEAIRLRFCGALCDFKLAISLRCQIVVIVILQEK